MHSLFFYTFVKMGQRVSGVFGDLDASSVGLTFSWQSVSSSWPRSCACAVLCCAYLQKPEQGCLTQKNTALPLSGPLSQPYSVLSHSMFLLSVLCLGPRYLTISVWDIYVSPLSSGLLQLEASSHIWYTWNSTSSLWPQTTLIIGLGPSVLSNLASENFVFISPLLFFWPLA